MTILAGGGNLRLTFKTKVGIIQQIIKCRSGVFRRGVQYMRRVKSGRKRKSVVGVSGLNVEVVCGRRGW